MGSRCFRGSKKKTKKKFKEREEAGEPEKDHRSVPASVASVLKLMMEAILSARADCSRVLGGAQVADAMNKTRVADQRGDRR